MSKSLFIAGTGTDVGKTFVTGLILKKLTAVGHKAAYYKAAMSGNPRGQDGVPIPGDAVQAARLSGISQPLAQMCPYVYENAVSPHLAARLEGNPVDFENVAKGFYRLCAQYDYVTVEGSGGIVCPIRYDGTKLFLWEIVKQLRLPCLLIADAGLGTINDVVLTVSFMREKGIEAAGIIFNRFHPGNMMEEDNRFMCEDLTGVKVLDCVCENAASLTVDADTLTKLFQETNQA